MAGTSPKPSADGPISHLLRGKSARRRRNRSLSEIAAVQHGVISLGQAVEIGLTERTLQDRVEAGLMYRIHWGVYLVGYRSLTRERRFMAAVLACGPEAVLSHRSAAVLWGFLERESTLIDITAPHRRGRNPHGIAAHRDGSLVGADRALRGGIPCTSVARTLLDFAAVAPVWELRKAISEAEVLRVLDHGTVRALIKRSRGRRGVARLRMVLDEIHPETKRTRSEMERRFLRVCTRTGLPTPEVNVLLDVGDRCLKPDFLWRDAGLILEADSRQYHDTDSAFQLDRRREQRLQLMGWRVARCTWEQIDQEPRELAATIRGLLANPKPPTGRFPTRGVGNRPVGGG